MSLIQEALKRQQQESGEKAALADAKPPVQQPANTPIALKRNAPQVDTPPAMPPPLPEASATSSTEAAAEIPEETVVDGSKKKKNVLVLAVVIVILILAAGGTWAYMTFMKPKPQTVSAPVPVQTVPTTTTTQPPPPAVLPAEVPVQPAVAANTSAPVQTAAVPTPAVVPPPAPEPPPAPVPEPAPAPAPAPVEEAVNWPTLTLTAVIAGKGDSGSAIINKQVVGVGETIEGVKIVAIRGKSVEIELKGKTQTLRIGAAPQ